MAELQQQTATAQAAEGSLSFLDRVIEATSQTPVDQTKDLLESLTKQALSGTLTWDKNLTTTIEKSVVEID